MTGRKKAVNTVAAACNPGVELKISTLIPSRKARIKTKNLLASRGKRIIKRR
jgi:hypothetical protein